MEGRRKYGDAFRAERVILASNKFFSYTMDDVRVRFPPPPDGRRRGWKEEEGGSGGRYF